MLSSPITVASAVAARTDRIRIGLAVVLLPLGHPVRLAEDLATLDHISQGRLDFGVGRGTFPDTHDGLPVTGQPKQVGSVPYDDWLRDKVVFGTGDAVVERLHELQEDLQLDQVMYEINFGRQLPYELQVNNLRTISEKVIPHFS